MAEIMSKCARFAATMAAVLTLTLPVFGQVAFILENREAARRVDRYGDVSLGAVIRTDERYNVNSLFQGPRGWDYWNLLPDPKPYQDPNLWPDKRPTYFFGNLMLPPGSTLTIHGKFPHARYFKFNFYKFAHNTFIAVPGAAIAGYDIEPDGGSGNPFRVGADRSVQDRNFSIQVVADDAPQDPAARPKNTLYVGRDGQELLAGFRIYVSDEGYDGAGWGPGDRPSPDPYPLTFEAKLTDGTKLSSEEVIKQLRRPMGYAPPPMTVDQWYAVVDSKKNDASLSPATAPARPDAQFELFYGIKYNVVGAFMTAAEQARIPLQTAMQGGGDPTTQYMVNYLSRRFGPVYVFRAKLPTFPNTFAGAKTMATGQVVYWSVVTVAAPPSGELWDGVFDMMVPVDTDGYYTIVVSRPEDRPKNATNENGVAWIDWGPGEGLTGPRNRTDWGMLLMRYMVCAKDWGNTPVKATKPGMAAEVMGSYYPRGYYTTKEKFEKEGPKKYGKK